MTDKIIQKWKIYCTTEAQNVIGYKVKDGAPQQVCFNDNTHTIDSAQSVLVENIYDNFTNKLFEWNIFCDTEQTNVIGFTNSEQHPELCFNNTTHVISQIPTLINKISNNNVRIIEEYKETGGYFQAKSVKFVCPVGVSTHDLVWPIPISVLSLSFITTDDHIGDTISNIVAPNTIVGAITSDVNTSDTVINVSQTVIDYINLGFFINITDFVNSDNLGRVTFVDTINNTITVETPVTNTFLAATPTYIQMSVKTIHDYTIGNPGKYVIGKSKIGGSYLAANTTIRVEYTNNGGSSKDFFTTIEFLY